MVYLVCMEITLSKPPEGYEAKADFKVPSIGGIVLTSKGEARKLPANTSNPHIVLRESHKTPKQGEVWDVDGDVYLVARVSVFGYLFIGIDSGNRRTDTPRALDLLLDSTGDAEYLAKSLREYFKGKL